MAVTLLSGLGSMSRAARMISGVTTLGRPPMRPRARAAARPSRVPETISSRMNSARAAKTWKTSLPPGVVVSRFSCREVKPIPRRRRSPTVVIVLEEAGESVQRWHDEGVPGVHELEAGGQFRPVGVASGLLLGEDAPAAGGFERVELALQFLSAGRYPGVADADVGELRWLGVE